MFEAHGTRRLAPTRHLRVLLVVLSCASVNLAGTAPSPGRVHAAGAPFTHATTPADHFVSLSVGTCGVTRRGALVCWGGVLPGQPGPAANSFSSVSVGPGQACAVRRGGARAQTVTCWGSNNFVLSPPGRFVEVSVGGLEACGIEVDGSALCWWNSFPTSCLKHHPPNCTRPRLGSRLRRGPFVQLSAGSGAVCGLRRGGSLTCWADIVAGPASPVPGSVPPGKFSAVSVGQGFACALRMDHTAVCWGDDTHGQTKPPAGTFDRVAAGGLLACAIGSDGAIVCWGAGVPGILRSPAGRFAAVTAGGSSACALTTDGRAVCWDANGDALYVPAAPFAQVSVAADINSACAIRVDGSLTCWGLLVGAPVPPGRFTQVSVSPNDFACAVRLKGSLACWAWSPWPGLTPPAGRFAQVSVGLTGGCAVRDSGRVVCWSDGLKAPTGRFTQVSVGQLGNRGDYACALRTGGSVACWGDSPPGHPFIPRGHFKQVSVGTMWGACALRQTGAMDCWPAPNDFPGPFIQISDGCGLRPDHVVDCWPHTGQFSGYRQFSFANALDGQFMFCGIRRHGSIRCPRNGIMLPAA